MKEVLETNPFLKIVRKWNKAKLYVTAYIEKHETSKFSKFYQPFFGFDYFISLYIINS